MLLFETFPLYYIHMYFCTFVFYSNIHYSSFLFIMSQSSLELCSDLLDEFMTDPDSSISGKVSFIL